MKDKIINYLVGIFYKHTPTNVGYNEEDYKTSRLLGEVISHSEIVSNK